MFAPESFNTCLLYTSSHVERVLRLTHALRKQLGVNREDRYAVLAMNGHEFIELYHAALFLSLIHI